MKEIYRKEARLMAISLVLGLGATACGSKPLNSETRGPKINAENAAFIEQRAATIEYIGNNLRRATITPGGLVFEEFCRGRNLHVRMLKRKAQRTTNDTVVEGARECQDDKITPSDFGESLNPDPAKKLSELEISELN